MTGSPRITRRKLFDGYAVERHLFGDRLGFLPPAFWVALSLDGNRFHNGHGRTQAQAVADMKFKQGIAA